MAENSDIMDQIQKQLEGNTLGLSAVADVLQKMEARLEQAEEYEYEEDLQLAEEEQYGALIQGVAQEVIAMIKADNEVGIDVQEKKVGGTSIKDDADDSPETIDTATGTPTKDAQDTIVAGGNPDAVSTGFAKGLQKAGMGLKKDDGEGREETEEERRRREEREGRDQDGIVAMKKQLEDLQKQVAGYQAGIQKSNDAAVSDRLERMGFREETGLQAPRIIPDETLGTENETFISKAQEQEDVVDQLSKLSFKELRTLQERVESGQTEGLPTELYS
jgi:hypothetical protein